MALNENKRLLVLGMGNTLREDDGVGIHLLGRLKETLKPGMDAREILVPDILLAEEIAGYESLLIIDAMVMDGDAPFKTVTIEPSESMLPAGGFVSHIFDWGSILAMAKKFFGKCPRAELCGVSAYSFRFSETLSPECERNAEEAFLFLADYCSRMCK